MDSSPSARDDACCLLLRRTAKHRATPATSRVTAPPIMTPAIPSGGRRREPCCEADAALADGLIVGMASVLLPLDTRNEVVTVREADEKRGEGSDVEVVEVLIEVGLNAGGPGWGAR